MFFDYDSKISDPDYYGGMTNITPKDQEKSTDTMEGWEKDDE